MKKGLITSSNLKGYKVNRTKQREQNEYWIISANPFLRQEQGEA